MLEITQTLRKNKLKRSFPFELIKDEILGKKYELSLVLCSYKLIQKLAKKYKGSSAHKNILSFPIDKNSGEIFINIPEAKKEAKKFGHGFAEHVLFLFIHGLLHLKGIKHSKKMEELEERLTKKYKSRLFLKNNSKSD